MSLSEDDRRRGHLPWDIAETTLGPYGALVLIHARARLCVAETAREPVAPAAHQAVLEYRACREPWGDLEDGRTQSDRLDVARELIIADRLEIAVPKRPVVSPGGRRLTCSLSG